MVSKTKNTKFDLHQNCGHYTKKFGLISSRTPNEARAERVVALTKIVRSEKAPRTGEYASNPERKNTPCISDLAGVKFLLKKERVFFFRGSALQVFGQCGGTKCETRTDAEGGGWGEESRAVLALI